MYNILITDDEQIAIDSLKFIISKNFDSNVNLFTAQSGTDALQIINQENIDIVFMDINMPGLTGLDTVSCINKLKPDTVIIIISAFDRFQYAQEAMNLGVYKYITKPVNRNVIIQTVRESMNIVDNKRGQVFDEAALQKKLDMFSPMIENDFMYSVIFSNEVNSDLSSYLEYFNIENPVWSFFTLEVPRVTKSNQHDTYMNLRTVLNEQHRFLVSSFVINRIAVFFPLPREYTDAQIFKQEVRRIYQILCNKIGTGIRMGVSGIETDKNNIISAYNDSLQVLNTVPRDGGIAFLGDEHAAENAGNGGSMVSDSAELQKKLCNRLKIGDSAGTRSLFDQYFKSLEKSCQNQTKLKSALMEFLINAKNITLEVFPSYSNPKFDDLFLYFASENDSSALKAFVNQLLTDLVSAISSVKSQKENPIIEKVCLYIDENLDKDLSLEVLASVADVSTFYLSKLFKEEKTENIINFVTNKRLDRARLLLSDSKYSIKEVAAFTGYNDQNYFSRLFKNKFGISPSEFRNN